MLINMLPEEKSGHTVYAAVTENNEVIWAYDNGAAARSPSRECPDGEAMIASDRNLFTVCKRGSIVIVEACGWYSSGFHFRFELTTEKPFQAVILANEVACLMDVADEGVLHP